MKILYLTLADIDDRSFGGAIRGNDIRDALLSLGKVHTLVVRGFNEVRLDANWNAHGVKHASVNRFGVSVAALRQRWHVRRWVARTLAEGHYDVIVARYLGLALYVPLRHWPRLILDADDIFKSADSGARKPLRDRARMWLRNLIASRLLRFAGHVWFVNPADAARSPSRRSSLLPNAISLPALDGRAREAAVPGRILMVGFFEHPPNAQGLRWFASEVLPELLRRDAGVELHVVGKHPASFEREFGPPVKLRGFVEDLAQEYDRAALVIAPIRSGGGTQIKVIEALAHGRPLVASPFAHMGFSAALHDGRDLLVAADAGGWVDRCARLLGDPAFGAALGRSGCAAVHANFGTTQLADKIAETLRLVASERNAA